jgi:hypothetical protein
MGRLHETKNFKCVSELVRLRLLMSNENDLFVDGAVLYWRVEDAIHVAECGL